MAGNWRGIHFGTDYYPEHWPGERWETDARLMQEMGIQVVRMAEFSWHRMEPAEGCYDFDWLEETAELLGTYGIKIILGTPSAAPPAWIINQYPEILPVDRQGRRRGFGGRHHDCQSNEVYRRYILKMVTAMAERFADNTNIIGWQIDNELGNSHGDLCTCSSCRRSYQRWLQNKYQDVESLNRKWGTAFWSQEYNDFSEVFTPQITVTGENPSAMLDWKCFHSDLIVEFQQQQIDILRRICPNQFITHNCMGFADTVNYFDLNRNLDFASHDQYPECIDTKQENHISAAALDITRGFKKQTYWIMEQQSGITGWQVMSRAPKPGQLAAWAEQSIAHGADAIVFFRWRTCTIGTEQYWHGILPHSGAPGRRYQELREMIQRLAPYMDEMEGSMPKAHAAIVFSYRQEYALQIQPNHPELNYVSQLLQYYKEFYKRNIAVDFVEDTDDLSSYRLVVAPLQYLMTPELSRRYTDYVENGGKLILTMRTGVKDEHNICMSERELPGSLGDLCGIEIPDYDCLRGTAVQVSYRGKSYTATKWSDIITLKGAEESAAYASEFYQGSPCITRNAYGAGTAYYIGTEPTEELLEMVMGDIIADAELTGLGEADPGVELMMRERENRKWFFAINYNDHPAGYCVPEGLQMVFGEKAGNLEGFEMHLYVNQTPLMADKGTGSEK